MISHLSECVCRLIIGEHGSRFGQGNQARGQVHAGAVHVAAVGQNLAPDEGDAHIRQLRICANLFGELQANLGYRIRA